MPQRSLSTFNLIPFKRNVIFLFGSFAGHRRAINEAKFVVNEKRNHSEEYEKSCDNR